MLWPALCVQWIGGAQFHPGLDTRRIARFFLKGTDPGIDSYSGLFDNGRRKATGLGDWLTAQRVEEVQICGLATDYCVKATAKDAAQLGFTTTLIEDACRRVDGSLHTVWWIPADDLEGLNRSMVGLIDVVEEFQESQPGLAK